MILKYDFWILKKYYIETIRFIINNFIFQIIHSYFAHTTKYKNHIIQKYMKSYLFSHCPDGCLSRLLCSYHRAGPLWKKRKWQAGRRGI